MMVKNSPASCSPKRRIYDNRRMSPSWDRDRDRVQPEDSVEATWPGHRRYAIGGYNPNHLALDSEHRIGPERPTVVASADEEGRDTRFGCTLHGKVDGIGHNHVAHGVGAVDDERRPQVLD
jgi:hypothetical protein